MYFGNNATMTIECKFAKNRKKKLFNMNRKQKFIEKHIYL